MSKQEKEAGNPALSHQKTITQVRELLKTTFNQLEIWFDKPQDLLHFQPAQGNWSIFLILEHITLTNHFLLLTIRKWSKKAMQKAERGQPIPEGESDLDSLEIIGQRGSFSWVRPEHMEPAGQKSLSEIRDLLNQQLQECVSLLDKMPHGEGALSQVRMSVQDLGKLDMYQWLAFLAQHAQRHAQQMDHIEQEFQTQTKERK